MRFTEQEISNLEKSEQELFLNEYRLEEAGLNKVLDQVLIY